MPQACTALQRFAENWQLPVACGFRFQDTFDNRHALYAGDVGIGINPKLAARVREADLIIALGLRLGEMTTGGYTLLQAPRPAQKLVHIHAGRRGTGPRLAADLLLQCVDGLRRQGAGDAGRAAAACPGAHGRQARTPTTWPTTSRRRSQPLDMAVVMKTVQRLVPADTVYTNGAGNYSGWLHRYVRYLGLQHHGRTQLAPTSGAMGYGVPAPWPRRCCIRSARVVNIAGDGDFLMTGQELATATGYGAGRGAGKLISIVVDNGSYGTIRMHQERDYPGASAAATCSTLTSRRWRGPTAGTATAGRCHRRFRARRSPARMAADRPTLIHVKLDTDVSTTRTTLSAIREAALRR